MFDLYQYLPRSAAARLARNGSQTSFIPTCLPVPRSRYARFPREDVPVVLRTGLPFELQTVPFPAFFALSRSPYPLPSYTQVVLPPSPGYSRRHDRSAGIIRRVNGRRYCMQDQPASCSRADAARYRIPPPPRHDLPKYRAKPRYLSGISFDE